MTEKTPARKKTFGMQTSKDTACPSTSRDKLVNGPDLQETVLSTGRQAELHDLTTLKGNKQTNK